MNPENDRFPLLDAVLAGETTDIYFLRSRSVLESLGRDPHVGAEIFAGSPCLSCGTKQVAQLLTDAGFSGEMLAIPEGTRVGAGQPVVQLFGRYSTFGIYETAMLGILASCSAWTTKAREVADAAADIPVVSFGARHVHPNVSAIMDYSAIVGGCVSASTIAGSRLAGTAPSGTMPHAYVLIMGDTVEAAKAFDIVMPSEVPRIVLVDTFQDEGLESVRVATALKGKLLGVRLDTPRERGGVTPDLVREIRARLDLAGHTDVKIVVSGGITPDRISSFRVRGAPVDSYGIGSFISSATPIDHTCDIREIDGQPVSKRGRIPGMHRDARLQRMI